MIMSIMMMMMVVMMMVMMIILFFPSFFSSEFEKQWAETPGAKELDITLLPATSDASKTDAITNDVNSSRVSPGGNKSPSPLKQDVEATV